MQLFHAPSSHTNFCYANIASMQLSLPLQSILKQALSYKNSVTHSSHIMAKIFHKKKTHIL